MLNQIPLQLISNFASIIIIAVLFYRYMQYKKNMDVIKGLEKLKISDELSQEDILFIKNNEDEYKLKLIKTESLIKFAKPLFILIVGLIFIAFPFAEALIHLNVVVVAFIFMQIDKIHKTNIYGLLYKLKKES
ncbi:hypothetical protein [Poseidonibacter ostreae]|jgi:hypothetical protein|uniref:Uncharacterized protein n=1 Tax=Poseidonibacter ostreae TaxID=2654171 RepID=A0A6L4WUP1_9BACT|nr:hypothetical protein [Poseidonibacter ostreae]KAB7884695.1 hypothetical protein GA417_10820 [Poseidonibacter ostreae]KAB7889956.1 hypothetical protein GBG19_04285 [Poseidonibacter ostreae]KAB7891470.1 hypothetical protein GBG18_06845 [Poseidonibacter ostreae]MAC83112.1 hypothetical protein [Arcobacter sp.]|tara:strand:- start:5423 stop:5821 length:399 start_codon:yes stop_codon:yes gene_type:complete